MIIGKFSSKNLLKYPNQQKLWFSYRHINAYHEVPKGFFKLDDNASKVQNTHLNKNYSFYMGMQNILRDPKMTLFSILFP